MVGSKIPFAGERAPCGKVTGGDHFRDGDDDGLVIRDELYDCGCRRIRHEYHDGSVHIEAIRCDGKPVKEEPAEDHGS